MKKSKIIEAQKRVIIALNNELTESEKRQNNQQHLSEMQHEHIQMFTTLLKKIAEVVGLESDVNIHEGWVSLPSKIKMMRDKISHYETVISVFEKNKKGLVGSNAIESFDNNERNADNVRNEAFVREFYRRGEEIEKPNKEKRELNDTLYDIKACFEMNDTEGFADLPQKNDTQSSPLDLWSKDLERKAANQWLGKH